MNIKGMHPNRPNLAQGKTRSGQGILGKARPGAQVKIDPRMIGKPGYAKNLKEALRMLRQSK